MLNFIEKFIIHKLTLLLDFVFFSNLCYSLRIFNFTDYVDI